jgi:pimeloyl-ACP methyl ester carboxylesterase
MSEGTADVGRGIELAYESLGDPAKPTVLLMMGLGLGLPWWRDDFCAELVARGFRVVRYDHRDVGRSTPFRGPGPSAWGFLRRRATTTYTLADLADDAAGLIAHLEPAGGGAHVVGVSMGAFVAQELAIRHPALVRSLVSIMGRPGDRSSGKVAWRMRPEFLRPAPRDPERAAEALVASFRRIGSRDRTEQDDEDVRVAHRRALARERGDGAGSGRQLAAILAERDRTGDLAGLRVPATVIHGTRDRVVLPSGGRATAAAIGGAELIEVEGMGHDLARASWPAVLDAIGATAVRPTPRG